MDVFVRTLALDDAKAYLGIRLRALQQDPLAFTSTYDEEKAAGISLAETRLQNPQTVIFGAFAGEILVGTVTLLLLTSVSAKHKASLVAMYAEPDFRAKGVGDALVNTLISRAKSIPYLTKMMLEVVAGNDRAQRFYVRHGFEVYGVESQATYLEGRFHDEVMMVRFLNV